MSAERSVSSILYRELVFDLDLYPRMEVDGERVGVLKDVLEAGESNGDFGGLIDKERVAHLRDVLKAGGVLPPIVVDASTHKVVDGFHRSRAYFSLHGADARIPCLFHEYEDRGAILLDAIRLNATHGKPLTRQDQTRCVALAERLNVTLDQVASVMNVRPDRVANLQSVRAKLATRHQVQPMRIRSAGSHAILTSGGNHARVDGRAITPPRIGRAEINALIRGLLNGQVNLRDYQTRQDVRALVKAALERLKETEAA